jgi:hypothetical protein
MALEKPPLATVEPGRPVTAQGWNAIVAAIGALYDAVLAFGSGTLAVSVQANGQPVVGAQVVAEPVSGGQPIEAIPLFGTQTTYLVTGVSDGNWRVNVSASGFTTQVVETTVPQTSPVAVNLGLAGVVVPDLFSRGVQEALLALQAVGLDVDVMIDALGHEVSKLQLPAEYQNAPVLAQLPEAGVVIDPATTRLRLVVAAAVRDEPVVVVPSLIGLTQAEASRALEQLGLRLGRVTVRS